MLGWSLLRAWRWGQRKDIPMPLSLKIPWMFQTLISETSHSQSLLFSAYIVSMNRLKGKFLGIWDLCSLTRVNSAPPALGTQSPNQSTAREVLERDTPEYKNIGMKL